jgi:small subunit ribosomal protein S20
LWTFFGGSTLANIKSQIKRNRQNEKRRVRNRVYRGRARTFVARARTAIASTTPKSRKAAVIEAISALDKAAEKGHYSQEQRCSPQEPVDEAPGALEK